MQTKGLTVLLIAAAFTLIQACGGNNNNEVLSTGGTGGKAGKDGGGRDVETGKDGGGAAMKNGTNIESSGNCTGSPPYPDQDCTNLYCYNASATPKLEEFGDCCKRVDLLKFNEDTPAAEKVYEYRVMWSGVISQPSTAGNPTTVALLGQMYDTSALVTLYRITGDLSQQGKIKAEIGPGKYNCDGTYSFFAKGIAPATTWSTDKDRFASTEVELTWYPDEGRVDMPIEELYKGIKANPVFDPNNNYAIGYEMPVQGYYILKFPVTAEEPDCVGSVGKDKKWNLTEGGIFELYMRMDLADKINKLMLIPQQAETLCQIIAFFLLLDISTIETNTCDMPRCQKKDELDTTCAWFELPDSLCPTIEADADIFPCHLGDKAKLDEAKKICDSGQYTDLFPKEACVMMQRRDPPCSDTAPTTIEDSPQCCDPLGKSDTIPACNAWRTVNKFAAAAVEITDEPSKTMAKPCK